MRPAFVRERRGALRAAAALAAWMLVSPAAAQETVTPERDEDGAWRVVGYSIA